jgi:hypothetical protein
MTVDGRRAELSLHKCDPTVWVPEWGRLKGRTEEIRSVNAYLDAVELKINTIFQTLIASGGDFDGERIKARYLGSIRRT